MLFSAFRLANHTGPVALRQRLEAVEDHYRSRDGVNVERAHFYDEKSRIGCHVVWQRFAHEKFLRCIETKTDIVAFSGHPFGYTNIIGKVNPKDIAIKLAQRLALQPSDIEKLHPPFSLMHLNKADLTILVYTDTAGYVRTFRLDNMNGFVLSNRAIAPFIISLTAPKLSELGWAAEQMNGYMYGEMTAFEGMSRSLPGTRYAILSDRIATESDRSVLRWFSEKAPSAFDGLSRLASEVDALGDYDEISAALTGGRDSRASAAFAFKYFDKKVRTFTSYPPDLERSIALSLAEKAPQFQRMENNDLAVRADGSTIWKGHLRKAPRKADMMTRAKGWAYIHEGSGICSALYNNCGMTSMFSPHTVKSISIPGIGGDLAKAYAYRPMQVSGVFAPDTEKWMKEVASIPAYSRLEKHSTTGKAALYFAREDYWPQLQEYIYSAFAQAQDAGVSGYRFFDYWYLVGRMAGAQTPGYTHIPMLMPFLVPEFIREGGTDTLERKIKVQLSRDMVDRYVPAWSSIPYYDEVQKGTDVSRLRFFQEEEFLWSGPSSDEFFAIIEGSDAFDAPYDRKKIVAHYRSADENGTPPATSNVKAHGLIYRHAMHELCRTVEQRIQNIRGRISR